jgi:isoleucyl-tRNA synthetase
MATKKPLKSPKKAVSAPNFLEEGEFKLPELEEKVLAFWDQQHIFEKSLAKKGSKTFVFYEGPPYANGKPAIHHVVARIVKDVILRYKTMQGYNVPRRAGWDTHGLPVEIATEKALGLKSKKEIEQFGVQRFNEEALKQVWLYKDEWERMTRRIGYWLDLKNAYVTYDPEYIESLWWVLSQISKRKLLFKGHKVIPWCTRDGTSLSSHELAQGYKEVSDTSVYVKFKLQEGQLVGGIKTNDAYILSWTTTPWTLPGNVALAVGENILYTALRVKGQKQLLILVNELVEVVFADSILEIVRDNIPGKELVGLEYEPLFNIPSLKSKRSYKVYPADFVTTTDGTGVVHTAVMYGEEDYVLGKKLGLPQHHTVNEDGKFTREVKGFEGQYVKSKETEDQIFKYLEKHGNLLRTLAYKHEYPFCWRCGTAIIYYARNSWFIGMSELRAELLKNNKTVNWTPAHVKAGRFGEWLREAKDWNLSRDRYWGTPLPIWECKECGHTEVVESMDALNKLSGGSKNNYWAVRHGESENLTKNINDSGSQHFHLTSVGEKQVEKVAKIIKTKKIDLVFASDLDRTKETAHIIAKKLNIKVVLDQRLREVNVGSFSGKPMSEYDKEFPHYADRFIRKPEGEGESLRDVRVRAWNFLQEMEKKHQRKNILIVSHEDVIWMMAEVANGWNEQTAIEQKTKKRYFVAPAELLKLNLKVLPRNDSGEVDLHRPFADTIFPPCPKCHALMKRVPEVADVWFDSGAMPYAQAHYPFSVPSKTNIKILSGLAFPADYIAEGMDQTRGWFYTLMAIATALGHEAPYKNVVALGLINDKFGQKMSKSKGNVVEPFAVIDKYGIDALRWYFFTGSPLGEPKNFDELEIAKSFRKTHLIVYNSFVFWKTYADPNAKMPAAPTNILDQWILARLDQVNDSVAKKLDAYEIREAAMEIEALVDDLSRWHIRRSRRRLQRSESAADYAAASATLKYVLSALIKMMAPFTPFFSEVFYAPLGGIMGSVHLDAWPARASKKRSVAVDKKLFDQMAAAREFATLGLAKRAEAGIKVRQPLASMKVGVKLGAEFEKIVAEEVNVKKIIYVAKQNGIELDTLISGELREEGIVRDVARMFQELRQKAGLSPKDKIVAMLMLPQQAANAVAKNELSFKSDIGAKSVEYKRSEKFITEETTKMDGQDAWVAIRKV